MALKPFESINEAIAELRECDHAFVSAEGVERFGHAFNVYLKPTLHKAEPNEPKGLTFHDGASEGIGMDASDMAERICAALGVDHPHMMGRGFRLRVCCDALQKHADAGGFDAP